MSNLPAPSRRRFLRNSTLTALALAGRRGVPQTSTEAEAHIEILPSEPIGTNAPEIYSHFIEHLGGVIYDGVWVGEKSKIANIGGVRKAFVDAMRAVKAPVLRWPGGCFADSYDWRDGIGPASKRPQRSAFWNQEDSNQYGLHEFMRTCRAIGCEPYLAADVRSLPARDFYQWVEYCNAPSTPGANGGVNTLAAQRKANGDAEPFHVRYWGVGNETWGCGGSQTAEEYGGEYRRYAQWLPRYGDKQPGDKPTGDDLRLIACGANGADARWTAGVMKSITNAHRPYGFSTHYYVSGDAKKFAEGDALVYDDATYYDTLARACFMDNIITENWAALGETDRDHRVKIVMDEWGAWYSKSTELPKVPGGPDYNLSQQSTMRDALLTGLTLDIFQKHADKIAMANVAQSINCIHSLMLASGDRFTVTPTFHVFQMYLPHRGAQSLRTEFSAVGIANPIAQVTPVGGNSAAGSIAPNARLEGLSGSASLVGKTLTLTVVNPHLHQSLMTEIHVGGASVASVRGTVLVADDVHAHNDFDHPNAVHPVPAVTQQPASGRLMHRFPAASVSALEITLV